MSPIHPARQRRRGGPVAAAVMTDGVENSAQITVHAHVGYAKHAPASATHIRIATVFIDFVLDGKMRVAVDLHDQS